LSVLTRGPFRAHLAQRFQRFGVEKFVDLSRQRGAARPEFGLQQRGLRIGHAAGFEVAGLQQGLQLGQHLQQLGPGAKTLWHRHGQGRLDRCHHAP
jgi:hypothetical protein